LQQRQSVWLVGGIGQQPLQQRWLDVDSAIQRRFLDRRA